MSVGKSGNSYSKLERGVADIEMPPVGFILGSEDSPSQIPIQEESSGKKEFGGLAALPKDEYEPDTEIEDESSIDSDNDEDDAEEEVVVPVRKTKDDNIRIMREKADRAERERDMMMNRMIEMEARQKQNQPKLEPVKEEIEEDLRFDINEDDLVDGKTAKKMLQKIERLEKKLNNQGTRSKEMITESRIKSDFPDFDKVVSVENVQRLNEEYPEVAITLRDTPDFYNRAASVYKIMKKFGIHKELYSSDKAKAVANSQKPRPLASVSPQQGDSPLSKANAFANGMTKELQIQLRKEMEQARKSL